MEERDRGRCYNDRCYQKVISFPPRFQRTHLTRPRSSSDVCVLGLHLTYHATILIARVTVSGRRSLTMRLPHQRATPHPGECRRAASAACAAWRALTARGVKTARGGDRTSVQVSNLLAWH